MVKKTKTKITKKTYLIKKTKPVKKTGVPVFSLEGKEGESIDLPEIFHQKINADLIAQAVRVYESALRQGTQFTKTRGEVIGSTRKIYRQKGTGRARHGDIKAPIFVGGGIVFGPKPRNFKLDLSQKMRRLVLASVLSEKLNNQKILVIKGFIKATGKTAEVAKLWRKINLTNKKALLILTPDMPMAIRASGNIPNVCVRPAAAVSFLDVMKNDYLVLAYEGINLINQVVTKK